VIFTASQEAYAGRLLDMLDTERHICHRLYRDACVFVDGNFVKDLDMLGRDIQRVRSVASPIGGVITGLTGPCCSLTSVCLSGQTTIVDNSPLAFAYHLDNGIPIESWFGERSDNHLMDLVPFLLELAGADDVRPLIRKKYAPQQRRHTTFDF
jgi:CTD small phosphatase-like protein 2